MTKYRVSLQKFAGMEIKADSAKEAELIAYRADESEYEFGLEQNDWIITDVGEVEEE